MSDESAAMVVAVSKLLLSAAVVSFCAFLRASRRVLSISTASWVLPSARY